MKILNDDLQRLFACEFDEIYFWSFASIKKTSVKQRLSVLVPLHLLSYLTKNPSSIEKSKFDPSDKQNNLLQKKLSRKDLPSSKF